jgi:uncharacterized protein
VKDLDRIKSTIRANFPTLREKYGVKSIGLFGSYVRGEHKRASDIDVLVEFYEPLSLFQFMALEDELTKLVGIKVDLVMKSALRPNIGKAILSEVIYL